MSRQVFIVLGIAIALMPHLGFPDAFDTLFYTCTGLAIAFVAWGRKRKSATQSRDTQVEEVEESQVVEKKTISQSPSTSPIYAKADTIETTSWPVSKEAEPEQHVLTVSHENHRQRNLRKRISQST